MPVVKRVLVTGGAGFVGHHLIRYLLDHTDWDIVTLDRLDFSGTLERLKEIEPSDRLTFVYHDLKAPLNDHVRKKLDLPDIIIHLAAASHVDRSIEDPLSFVEDNVIGTVNLLEYARFMGGVKFIYFSTDEVFGPAPPETAYREGDAFNPNNPYAASKAAAESMCQAYANTYKMNICITHTMNVVGTRQHPEKFIPSTIRKLFNGERITIHGSRSGISGSRFYIDANDVASAILFLLLSDGVPNKVNIVGARETSNLDLAKELAHIMALPLVYDMVDFHSSRPGHDLRYALDGSLMKSLGWAPTIPLTVSLCTIVSFTLSNKRWLNL